VEKILKRGGLSLLILCGLCLYLFFFRLGDMALTDPDETFYAQSAKEMLERSDWLTPHLYGKPQFEKPVLFYWLVKASFKIFGVNEFAARFPSAVFGLLGVIAIYLLGTILFNRKAGFLSAVILATNVEYIVLSRACVTDMTLFTLMLLGVLFFFYGYMKEKGFCYVLSSAAFALAVLTKGPLFIMLPVLIVLIYLFLVKDLKAITKMPVVLSVIVFIAVAVPWYLVTYKVYGKEFIDSFFGFHNITRFTQAEHKIGSQFYYNIPVVFAGFFPWSVFLPFGFWHLFKKGQGSRVKGQGERGAIVFLFTWFLVIFGFFSVSSTKLPTYIFPSFLSAALITGAVWDDFLHGSKNAMKPMRFSYYILLAAIIIGGIGLLAFINFDYPVISKSAVIAGSFLIFGMLLSFVAFTNKKYLYAFFLIAYAVAIFLYPLSRLVLPQIERYETSKEVATELIRHMKADERLGSESNNRAGLAFYTGAFPIDVDLDDVMVKFMNSDDRIWCVMKEKNHIQLYDPEIHPFGSVRPSYMVYKLGKRAIITNKIPEDGIYIIKREAKQ